MKIKKIALLNNKLFGDIELKLFDDDNKVFDTIIFAGENGVGKTLLLEMINEFSHLYYAKNIPRDVENEKRFFTLELTDEEIAVLRTNVTSNKVLDKKIDNNEIEIWFDYSKEKYQISVHYLCNGKKKSFIAEYLMEQNAKKIFKSIYASTEVNFTSTRIENSSSMDIDQSLGLSSIKSNSNLATEIKQLLLDIQTLDNEDIRKYCDAREGNIQKEEYNNLLKGLRMQRFTKAFDVMFEEKEYLGIMNLPNEKQIYFREYGREMSIDALSSGEKQIVYRGGFFLRDLKRYEGAFALIDEPEISMHPNWQLKILDFYKTLLSDSEGKQQSQMFIATHSPFIIHGRSTENREKVIILKKSDGGKVYIPEFPEFISWDFQRGTEIAFSVDIISSNDKPIVFVEGETDEKYLKKALALYRDLNLDIEIKWVGRMNKSGGAVFTGASALNKVRQFLLANSSFVNRKVILLYDCDVNENDMELTENLYVMGIPRNIENTLYKRGIENLLTVPTDFPKDDFYSLKKETDEYGATKEIQQLNKMMLCDWILTDSVRVNKLLKNRFSIGLMEKISDIFNNS